MPHLVLISANSGRSAPLSWCSRTSARARLRRTRRHTSCAALYLQQTFETFLYSRPPCTANVGRAVLRGTRVARERVCSLLQEPDLESSVFWRSPRLSRAWVMCALHVDAARCLLDTCGFAGQIWKAREYEAVILSELVYGLSTALSSSRQCRIDALQLRGIGQMLQALHPYIDHRNANDMFLRRASEAMYPRQPKPQAQTFLGQVCSAASGSVRPRFGRYHRTRTSEPHWSLSAKLDNRARGKGLCFGASNHMSRGSLRWKLCSKRRFGGTSSTRSRDGLLGGDGRRRVYRALRTLARAFGCWKHAREVS